MFVLFIEFEEKCILLSAGVWLEARARSSANMEIENHEARNMQLMYLAFGTERNKRSNPL